MIYLIYLYIYISYVLMYLKTVHFSQTGHLYYFFQSKSQFKWTTVFTLFIFLAINTF